MRSPKSATCTAHQSRSPLHVGQFVDSMDPGGAEALVLELSARLGAAGIAVTLLHFGNPWLTARAEESGVAQIVLQNRDAYRSKFTLPLFAWQLRQVLVGGGIDVLHSHLLGAVVCGALSARMARIPAVGTLHDAYSLSERWAPEMLRLTKLTGCRIVAVSNDIKDEARARGGRGAGQITVVYNGIGLERFDACRRAPREDAVVLVAVARFVPVKRLDVLLEAASRIRARNDWQLHLIGEGPEGDRLAALATDLGLGDRVRFLGFRSDIPAQLAASDVFVLSSDSEGLSVSLMESMAAGLPSVVTDVGGNREVVEDSVTGYLVPPREPLALAAKLSLLIDDTEQRRRLGDAARSRAARLFDARIMVDRYLELYRSLVSSR